MGIINIDDENYAELYKSIDANPVIKAFQKFKLFTFFPVLRMTTKKDSVIDIGCARGNFLRTLRKHGYTDLTGLDLKNRLYKDIEPHVAFLETSITDESMAPPRKFKVVTVQAMLHHLPVDELASTAANLVRLLEEEGTLYIYEPNMASRIGNFFYFYFLRLFPSLYVATMEEKDDQLKFCAAWPAFVESLRVNGATIIRQSDYSFYKVLIARKLPLGESTSSAKQAG